MSITVILRSASLSSHVYSSRKFRCESAKMLRLCRLFFLPSFLLQMISEYLSVFLKNYASYVHTYVLVCMFICYFSFSVSAFSVPLLDLLLFLDK